MDRGTYKEQGTIQEALNAIDRHELVLPAIQREFIWSHDQVCHLFDSLMRGYPFGTFLYWKVAAETNNNLKWYDFILNHHQKDAPHNAECGPTPNTPLTAVLDGQQRLTALNIGLRGSMAWKLPHTWWKFSENFPTRRLHLNLLSDAGKDAEVRYQFRFLRDDIPQHVSEKESWFRVSDIRGLPTSESVHNWLDSKQLHGGEYALDILDTLRETVHERQTIFAYEEPNQEMEGVLQIFNRMNRGGTPLSYSDLLLSVIVAQFGNMRNDIHKFVDELNQQNESGFNFSKDFVLKAGLMLLDVNVDFKVANFNKRTVDRFRDEWEKIKSILRLTVRLAASFGFSQDNLRTSNALLPIAYYLYQLDPGNAFLTSQWHSTDRAAIRMWLIRSLLKRGIWGGGIDALLTALRRVIKDKGVSRFPLDDIKIAMVSRGRPLDFDEDEIGALADMRFGDHRVFLLFTLLFPFLDFAHQFHVDHVYPAARFTDEALTAAGISSEEHALYYEMMNSLANLQLLEGSKNMGKQATRPTEWLDREHSDPAARQSYVERHLLGSVPNDLHEFETFYNTRRELLKDRIKQLLG